MRHVKQEAAIDGVIEADVAWRKVQFEANVSTTAWRVPSLICDDGGVQQLAKKKNANGDAIRASADPQRREELKKENLQIEVCSHGMK